MRVVRHWMLVAGLMACGCAHMTNAERGALGGGAIGAGTGALIGGATGHPVAGALIGTGVGALSGGMIGKGVDNAERRAEARLAAATATPPPPPLGIVDIAQMAQQHISDAVIINQIRTTNSVYHLSPQDIGWLKANGVSDAVIIEMQATAQRQRPIACPPKPVYVTQPSVVVIEQPPPPIGFGFGVGYSNCRRRCR
ncbi:MAG: glycine zipper domain-containing protein [Gemmataceae bacterium]